MQIFLSMILIVTQLYIFYVFEAYPNIHLKLMDSKEIKIKKLMDSIVCKLYLDCTVE